MVRGIEPNSTKQQQAERSIQFEIPFGELGFLRRSGSGIG